VEIDIQQRQYLESLHRSERDRLANAEKKLKGLARILYLEKRVKLNNAAALAECGMGLGLMKLKPQKVKGDDANLKKKR
tara:strand:- start:66 stop:302 length:237 start_codon:yes stop_codon:yes gene_type:complete